MTDKLKFSRVSDVQQLDSTGPWNSKSGGVLQVSFALNKERVKEFQGYDAAAFSDIEKESGEDVRGLRVYNVSNIPNGSVGANEYHLARTEIVSVLDGASEWRIEDIYGDSRIFIVDKTKSLVIPPGLLHTYTATEDNTRIQVICNTLFIPDNHSTHDSYMIDDFRRLQQKYKSN